jgi:hypothetical protein
MKRSRPSESALLGYSESGALSLSGARLKRWNDPAIGGHCVATPSKPLVPIHSRDARLIAAYPRR